jgi:hypothetical protein
MAEKYSKDELLEGGRELVALIKGNPKLNVAFQIAVMAEQVYAVARDLVVELLQQPGTIPVDKFSPAAVEKYAFILMQSALNAGAQPFEMDDMLTTLRGSVLPYLTKRMEEKRAAEEDAIRAKHGDLETYRLSKDINVGFMIVDRKRPTVLAGHPDVLTFICRKAMEGALLMPPDTKGYDRQRVVAFTSASELTDSPFLASYAEKLWKNAGANKLNELLDTASIYLKGKIDLIVLEDLTLFNKSIPEAMKRLSRASKKYGCAVFAGIPGGRLAGVPWEIPGEAEVRQHADLRVLSIGSIRDGIADVHLGMMGDITVQVPAGLVGVSSGLIL